MLEPLRVAKAEGGLIYPRQIDSPRARSDISASCLSSHLEPSTMLPQQPEPHLDPTSSNKMCHLLNATFLFLFTELRDMALVRNLVMNKIRAESEKLLQTKLTGKVLE